MMVGFPVQADPSQQSRHEDAVIAWTWKTFIENSSDPEILLRMPMTKVFSFSQSQSNNTVGYSYYPFRH